MYDLHRGGISNVDMTLGILLLDSYNGSLA